jgi:uncharacterized membrane protein
VGGFVAQFCSFCGAQIAEAASFCTACGKPLAVAGSTGNAAIPGPPAPSSGGLTDNVAGMLAYITIIPAIVFLVLEPYNKKPFVRFHAFQSIFFAVAWTALWIVLGIFGRIALFGVLELIISPLIGLAGLVLWLLLLLKAYQGKMWKLPVIGDMAEKQAGIPPADLKAA